MGNFVNELVAIEASENGILLGKTDPSRETKYSWWEVFFYQNKVIACVCFEGGVSCGEEITEEELTLYVDDEKIAKENLAKAKEKEIK